MSWNWELPDWPHFKFDPKSASSQEKQFLLRIGSAAAFLKTLKESEYHQFIVEILSLEGMESARIEGEIAGLFGTITDNLRSDSELGPI